MKLYRKYFVTAIFLLLIGAVFIPGITSQTCQKTDINLTTMGRAWSDNFDSYTTGQFLDGTPDDGGWKGWDDDPQFGAYVVDDQAISTPHSVEIAYDSDLIHEYTGYTFGQWTYIAWVYVPEDFVGNSYFMILSDYEDGAGAANKWQFVMRFDSDSYIVESENDGNYLPLITDQWVEIRVEIDLDSDWFQLYYDSDLLVERAWTAGWDGAGDGFLVIDAVDLFASGASEIYYDDMSLTGEVVLPDLECDGSLTWSEVEPGSTVTEDFAVGNLGDAGSILNWEVSEYPDWGTWTFTPISGSLPDGDWETVQVTVVAPDESNTEFNGTVKVINSDNPDDFCEIAVYLQTPLNSQQTTQQNTMPLFFQILQQILHIR